MFRGAILFFGRKNYFLRAKEYLGEVKIFRATAEYFYDNTAWPKRNPPRRRLKKPAKRSSNVFVAALLFTLNTGHPSRCFFWPGFFRVALGGAESGSRRSL
jgi:hypothetical protein